MKACGAMGAETLIVFYHRQDLEEVKRETAFLKTAAWSGSDQLWGELSKNHKNNGGFPLSWSTVSPSNIALIKYMGKIQHPCNQAQDKNSSPLLETEQLQQSPETTFSQYLHIPIDIASHLSKEDEELFWFKNLAVNSSLSYTLRHLATAVLIESGSHADKYQLLKRILLKTKNGIILQKLCL